tara:strand:+ start:34 stop:1341 length:1308 start_codon:yes stop_codon:yes gene_type:complete
MNKIKSDNVENIAVIGLGYVGLPLAVELSKKNNVVGFDINKTRIKELKENFDRTNELSEKELSSKKNNLRFTTLRSKIKNSNIYIVTVPTPVDKNNKPYLEPLISASKLIGSLLKKNNIVIYESTVYPGCTEEVCVPILEKESNLVYNKDFSCGYSPERVNPGDSKKTLTKIVKVVSGSNEYSLKKIDDLYRSIIVAGTYKASSIKVAEAAKVIENTQRDLNIALINELALIFDRLEIDTSEVLEAASTKWNFIPFKPGLVGGHCIGVDPYYLTHKAMEVGYHPQIILAGRRLNDNIGQFIASKTISHLIKKDINPIGAKVAILGLTFKEDCPDLRDTKVSTIFWSLKEHQVNVVVSDSQAIRKEAKDQLGIDLISPDKIRNQDAIIIAVCHAEYFHFKKEDWNRMLKDNGVIIDVKSIYSKIDFNKTKFSYWSL